MSHISVPIANTMEFIEQTAISPLISKCSIKVCYVGEQPNRNRTVISKDLALEMGRQLPGSPIVGYYNEASGDFETHNKDVQIQDGKFKLVDATKPYGFVAPDAKVWFEKFSDDGVEHEYLCTEGYIWTGAYPESNRIIEHGNNQSMELEENSSGYWTNDVNSGKRIFIYNEALIEKLCILGEEFEPCFEGASIKAFSIAREEFEEFKTRMFSMISELQEAVNTSKGGSNGTMDDEKKVNELESQPADPDYEKKPDEDKEEKTQPEGNSDKENNNNSDNKSEGQEDSKKDDDDSKEEDKKKYDLEDVVEYQELKTQFDELTINYSALQAEHETLVSEKAALDTEVEALRTFKLETEKSQKQAMIDKFYMLSDEDKKDVVENINTYSLDDIEAKLSVICVRNKLNLAEDQEDESDPAPTGFSLEGAADSDNAPAWIKRVRENNKV